MSKQYPGGIVSKTPVTPTSLSAPGIWTMNQQAAAQATNTWPFPRDPQFNYVTMLLHGDGSGGPTSLGMGAGASPVVTPFNADASTNNFNVTINGDAKSNNFTPYQAGYYSNSLNGSSNFTAGTTASNFLCTGSATGITATFEAWVYLTAYSTGGSSYLYSGIHTKGTTYFNFGIRDGAVRFYWYDGAQKYVDSASTSDVPLNTWTHVALTINGSTIKIYINGALSTTSATYTGVQSAGSGNTEYIGKENNGYYFNGYISNYRFTNTVVYSAAFTPSTTPLTAVTGTQLLICQSNRFIDNSSNNFTITPVSSPQVSPAQPFTLPSSVATYGSGYFDGTGDSLSLASNAAFGYGTGDFSFEFWAFPSVSSDNNRVIFHTDDNFNLELINSGGSLLQFFSGSARTSSPYTYTVNAWNHCAITRQSGTARMFINGRLVNNFAFTSSKATSAVNIATNGTVYFTGNLTDVRIVKGGIPSAYVTSSTTNGTQIFTPPTAPLSISDSLTAGSASLLTTQYNGGGNNSGFKDSSQFNFPITRNGNTTQGTFTPYGSNWSTSFNGSSDFITTPQTTSLNIGTGTFTVEAFVYLNSKYTSGGTSIINLGNGANGGGPYTGWGLIIDYDAGGSTAYPAWYRYDGSVTQYTSSTSLNIGQWYHLAVARDSSNNIAIWVNGTRVFSSTSTVTYNNVNSDPLNIGKRTNGSANSPNWMNGYISNGRVVIGSNVYDPTSSTITVPTTPLTAVTNTQLLVLQSNRFVDNSSAARTITVAGGSPSVQRFSPFSPTTAYSTSVIGGSGYFDGSGDYLTELTATTALNLSSGDWSISFWVYKTATANGSIVNLYNSAGNTSGLSIWIGSSGVKVDNGISGGVQAGTVVVNAWSYIEVIRSSGTTTIYVNGVSAGTTTQTPNASQYGSFGSAADGTLPHQGYITDLRIVKGTALSSSVPTAPLTAITNTSLLLNYTNAGILDNAMMNDLETVGNAQISTSVKKYGTGSMYFDGTDDRLNMPSSPNLAFGTGDFTLEMWAYFTSVASFPTLTDSRSSTGSTAGFNLGLSTAKVQLYTTSQLLIGSSTLSTNTWYHIAVTRASGTLKIWLNGTQDATVSNSTNWSDQTFVVGATPSAANFMTGYIDDLRITKYARYTTTFTVPDQAFPNG